jgi:PAS domain S-box-containing protein
LPVGTGISFLDNFLAKIPLVSKMSNIFIFRWLKNVSLTRKLYFVVGIMAILIAVELFTLSFMIHTLSSTRALVGAEGLWSKSEKDAVYSLTRYGYTHNEKDYQEYIKLLNVPLGDHKARLELFKATPDLSVARQGFTEGRVNANDIDGAINLLRRFHDVSYIKKAIAIWTQGDENLTQLEYLGDRLHRQVSSSSPDGEINGTIQEVYELNVGLTILEDQFSYTLGEGSRWIENLILEILFIIAMTVEFSGLFLTVSVSRAISKGINEIVTVASRVSQSDFTSRAKVFSQDEIGLLATSFNKMIDDLKKKIEEEKLAKEALHVQQELYKTLITAQSEMGEGVSITDGEKIVYVNDATCKMYGYSRSEILNFSSFLHLVPEEEKLKLVERLKERLKGNREQASGETKIMRKDGTVIDVEYTVCTLFSEGRQLVISIIRNVTEKNIAAHQLRHEKARAESAEISKKIGERFLANMSHEIRTPMNAILGFTDILENTPLSPEQREYLDAIKISGDNLLVIINDILDFSRMRSGKMPIEKKEFTLSKIITTSAELMQPKAKEKGLTLYTKIGNGVPDNLIGDPTRLMQVLLNLTANAIKFTEKGKVSITINKLEEVNNIVQLQIQVKDTGIGIPEDQLESIFDAFTQVNNETARVYGGTGLGLAIVKQLADIQGGSVSVTSEPGEGSCFNFTIGYQIKKGQTKQAENNADEEATVILKDLRVLVAEDNIMNQVLAKKVLSDWGWEVDIADDGERAIELLKQKNFDVVLMDIQLPKMDGYQATHYIRSNLSLPKKAIPIIAMTACAMEGEEEKCLKAGMNGYVSKPFNTKTLYTNISKVLNKAS